MRYENQNFYDESARKDMITHCAIQFKKAKRGTFGFYRRADGTLTYSAEGVTKRVLSLSVDMPGYHFDAENFKGMLLCRYHEAKNEKWFIYFEDNTHFGNQNKSGEPSVVYHTSSFELSYMLSLNAVVAPADEYDYPMLIQIAFGPYGKAISRISASKEYLKAFLLNRAHSNSQTALTNPDPFCLNSQKEREDQDTEISPDEHKDSSWLEQ